MYYKAYVMELQEMNRIWVSGPGNMFLCDVFGKDWAPWTLGAGICCIMAVHVHVKIFIYREVWRTGAAHKANIFECKQENSYLKRTTIWHYYSTPGFKQLSHPVKEAKIRSHKLLYLPDRRLCVASSLNGQPAHTRELSTPQRIRSILTENTGFCQIWAPVMNDSWTENKATFIR